MKAATIIVVLLFASKANGATLAKKARESGCTEKPHPIAENLYKCTTMSGEDAFFNARTPTPAEKAKESGCASKPIAISATLYKCTASSGQNV